MEHNEEMQKERQYLYDTIAAATTAWEKAAANLQTQAQLILETHQERMAYNSADIGGLYSAQGFLDLLDTSQGASTLYQAEVAKQGTERTLHRLARAKEAPYFARIDFQFENGSCQSIYIGHMTLMDSETKRVWVYDWRAPIAGVFYRYGVGEAQYEAPVGIVRGRVVLKRQYEILKGELQYYFDANTQVWDTFLREILSRPSENMMKSIVETIQQNQDRIIRDLSTDLLMVQGAAGSGKTSVALHRAAYLMYQGLQSHRLLPKNILIIAPNAAFENYISQMLPDMGEEQVETCLMEDLLTDILPDFPVQAQSAWVEDLLACPCAAQQKHMNDMKKYKDSLGYREFLDRFLREIPRRWIPFADIDYDGHCVCQRERVKNSLCNGKGRATLGARLQTLEKEIWERIRARRGSRHAKLRAFADGSAQHAMEQEAFARMISIEESAILSKHIRAFTQVNSAELYRRLYANREAFHRLSDGFLPPQETEAFRLATLEGLAKKEIPCEDASAIAYLEGKIYGFPLRTHIRQVLVDEAQDVSAMQFAILSMLFTGARFTVLGDVSQSLMDGITDTLYTEIPKALGKENHLMITLDKSFRSTKEIWEFSAKLLPSGVAGECFSRSGAYPRIFATENDGGMDDVLVKTAKEYQQMGSRSIAIICKTEKAARHRYERLKERMEISLAANSRATRRAGVIVTWVYMAKGLEFDAVLLTDTDCRHYPGEKDRKLLYIGCTRALHHLSLFYTGERSPLLLTEREVF